MNRLIKSTLLAGALLALSACGFHLRGLSAPLTPLPFASIAIQQAGSLAEPLQSALQRDGRVQLQSRAADAEVVLTIDSTANAKDILTINRGGKVNEYLLTYRVEASVQRKGDELPLPLTVVVRRELSYSDSAVLGKEREEALLLEDMRRDAVQQLIRRLAYLPAPQSKPDASIKP
ncbi:LPS-assembly lipoprotein LptE precursor [compost metagenome]